MNIISKRSGIPKTNGKDCNSWTFWQLPVAKKTWTTNSKACKGASWSFLLHSWRCLFASGVAVVGDVPAVVGVIAVEVRGVGAAVGGVSVGADAVFGVGVGSDVLPAVSDLLARARALGDIGAGVVVGSVLEAAVGAGAGVRTGSCQWCVIAKCSKVVVENLARRTGTHKGVGLLRTGASTSSSS